VAAFLLDDPPLHPRKGWLMGKILRISNLSNDTTAKDLRTLFEGVGTIAGAKISRKEETGESKGYGYVKMETAHAANSAIVTLNGRTLKGQEIRVRPARRRSDGKPGHPPRPSKKKL